MARCFECEKEIPGNLEHFFCGYGYAAQFCAKCCPREYDGTVCDALHPGDEGYEEEE